VVDSSADKEFAAVIFRRYQRKAGIQVLRLYKQENKLCDDATNSRPKEAEVADDVRRSRSIAERNA